MWHTNQSMWDVSPLDLYVFNGASVCSQREIKWRNNNTNGLMWSRRRTHLPRLCDGVSHRKWIWQCASMANDKSNERNSHRGTLIPSAVHFIMPFGGTTSGCSFASLNPTIGGSFICHLLLFVSIEADALAQLIHNLFSCWLNIPLEVSRNRRHIFKDKSIPLQELCFVFIQRACC